MQPPHFGVGQGESTLQMGVAEESDLRGRIQQAVDCLGGREDVFVFIAERTVNHHKAVHCQRSLLQTLEPFAIFTTQLIAGPQSDSARHWVEIVGISEARTGLIVISPDDGDIHLADPVDNFVGIWTVTDHVAEADYLVPMALGSRQGGFESRYVCVNVAEDQIPHASVPITVANYSKREAGLHEIARKKIGRASCLPNSGRLGEPLRLRECR